MSLDVCLTTKDLDDNSIEVYDSNITHNLSKMADKAGIYYALWRPHQLRSDYDNPKDDYDVESKFEDAVTIQAKEIIDVLEKGLKDLKKRPEYFKKFNAENGWGMYGHFVPFVEKYLETCKKYPSAIIEVSR